MRDGKFVQRLRGVLPPLVLYHLFPVDMRTFFRMVNFVVVKVSDLVIGGRANIWGVRKMAQRPRDAVPPLIQTVFSLRWFANSLIFKNFS